MRVLYRNFLLALLLSVTLAHPAAAKKTAVSDEELTLTCRRLILGNKSIEDAEKKLLYLEPAPVKSETSYHIKKVLSLLLEPAKKDLVSYVIRKHSSWPWLINYDENGNSLGDTRWNIMVFGAETARFFSLAMISKDEMLIPGASLLNDRIRLFNEGLPANQRIPIHFLGTDKRAIVDFPFISLFSTENALPLAEDGFQQLHDLYHFAWLYIPPEYSVLVKKQMQAVREFKLYLESHYPRLAKKNKRFLERFIRLAAISLDANGNITPLAAGMDKDPDSRLSWDRTAQLFLLNGGSPLEKVSFLLEETNGGKPLKDLDLLMAYEKFRQQAPKDWAVGIGKTDGATLEKAVRERILFIQKRIKEISSKPVSLH